ncbi:acyclic terpene utilization AtuA family protein [Phenylobacterium sp.]|uniref:acyclic terpene utilization AtuA family protein n=1 Tax=Phenylobacterium sp. TaxID=1871053 RepID=UPI0035696DA0
MSPSRPDACRVLVPSGVLGSGCPQAAFDRGLTLDPHVIAVDAGSTDSGPYYLGAGVSKMTRKAVKRDLRQLMVGRAKLGIPLLIGSCGTSGTDAGVDWMAEICTEIAAEESQSVKVALLYSEQDPERLATYLAKGAISPLAPAGPLTAETLKACDHIVGLMGFEPFAAAIEDGADIVLAGRTTDTAVLAAVPLMRGLPVGPSWHAGKTAECGGLCTTKSRNGGVMLSIDAGGFDVEPLAADNSCTPRSVSAHMLYENSDPYELREPGVMLNARDAVYTAIDERSVRVTGSSHVAMPYTLKLEGSGAVGYRTMVFSAISDPKIMAELDRFLGRLRDRLAAGIRSVLGYEPDEYDFDIRAYGANALGQPGESTVRPAPLEVGLMALVTAPTQDMATEIAKFSNPMLLHFPLNPDDPMPSFAFPFSPAEVELGRLYEFKLQHIVSISDPLELVRTSTFTTHQGERLAVA